ncbi:MAG TPA: multicopper oxidase domain-containing protein [Symbiobacteriaceae bacterium]|nr:multicopper oxidase domain-containing protein [Symbiobacteriaceae bacterium]
MQRKPLRHWLLTALLAVSLGAMLLPGSLSAAEAVPAQTADLASTVTTAKDGVVERSFTLYATDGYTTLPDGEKLYIWGYSGEKKPGTATLPGPRLRVNEGERVNITLVNIGPSIQKGTKAQHTIHLHGLDVDQANDGVPHTSLQLNVGEEFTYTWTATHAGTYWYHCHVDTIEHLQMGMYGAIVVMPKDGSNRAWTGGPEFDREVTMVLSEADPAWHGAVETRKAYGREAFKPRYHLINGKGFPDVASDPESVVAGEVGETVLVRLINAGYTWRSMHMHGFHFKVIASDGRPMPFAWEKDTLSIAPGERYDILVTLDKKGAYPFHSHAIVDNLNAGVYPGGMHTMVYAGVPIPAAEAHAEHSTGSGNGTGSNSGAGPADGTDAPLLTPVAHSAELTLEATSAKVNSKAVTLDTAPVLKDDEVMVSSGALRDLLGANVAWDGGQKRLTITRGLDTVRLWVGKTAAQAGGTAITLKTAPVIEGTVIRVPLQAVVEAMGGTFHNMGQTYHITLPGEVSISIKSSAFTPPTFRVKAGTVVVFRNDDAQAAHTIVTDDWLSPVLGLGGKFTHRFDKPGTYPYWCDLHTNMTGTVIVE